MHCHGNCSSEIDRIPILHYTLHDDKVHSRTIARMLCNRVNYFCSKKSELKYNLRLNSHYCINKAFRK